MLGLAEGDLVEKIIFETPLKNLYYFTGKLVRFTKKLPEWLVILWRDEDWDSFYLRDIMEFKLKRLEKCIREDNIYVDSQRNAKRIRIALEHLERFKNIDDYTIPIEYDFNLETEEINGKSITKLKNNMSKRDRILLNKRFDLERWHYSEFFRILSKYFERWST